MAVDRVRFPTEVELHRAAAWWAGEGSVSGSNRRLCATFCQKEEVVCFWFLELFGGSVAKRKPNRLGGETSNWSVTGNRAREFLFSIVELIPESPRRQMQIRKALEETAGRRKTGPKPKDACFRGHQKQPGTRCKECEKIWNQTAINKRRLTPELVEAHRKDMRERYQNDPAYAQRKREYQRNYQRSKKELQS